MLRCDTLIQQTHQREGGLQQESKEEVCSSMTVCQTGRSYQRSLTARVRGRGFVTWAHGNLSGTSRFLMFGFFQT